MAAPAYLEANARIAIPSRLRPPAGGVLDVVLVPRPPLSASTLYSADQTAAASINWLDDNGTGHMEPLWLASAPPPSEGVVEVDRYGGTFARARTSINLNRVHTFTFVLASTAGPGGALLADTAELRAMGGALWFDHGGQLGHVKGTDGTDLLVESAAAMIDGHTLMSGQLDDSDPAHPALALELPTAARRRATLGDLVQGLNDFVISLTEVNANEIDITGAAPVPPPPEPEVPGVREIDDVYAPVADLMKMLGGGQGGQDADRCALALIAASFTVDAYIGRELPTGDVPVGSPVAVRHIAATGGIRSATLALAVRFYKNPENWSGVIAPDTVGVYVARYVSDLDLYIAGQRERWGIA